MPMDTLSVSSIGLEYNNALHSEQLHALSRVAFGLHEVSNGEVKALPSRVWH